MADFEQFYIRKDNRVYLKKYPIIELSDIQKDLLKVISRCNSVWVEWGRRLGKTTSLALNFFDKLIMEKSEGEWMKHGQISICAHAQSMEVYNKFAGNYFLLPMGGAENINAEIDQVWIPLPEPYQVYLAQKSATFSQEDYEWWFGDGRDSKAIIDVVDGVTYVKLFKNRFDAARNARSSESIYKAALFNGAEIFLVGANFNFEKGIRGLSIYNAWFEELGIIRADTFSAALLPAIKMKRGFFQASYTPPDIPNPKDHWLYSQTQMFVEFYKKHDIKKLTLHGVDYYIAKSTSSTPIKQINTETGEIEFVYHDSTVYKMISIGKYSKAFWFSHHEVDKFGELIADVSRKLILKKHVDKDGKAILEDGIPKIDIVDTKQINPAGQIKYETFLKEFELVWDTMEKHRIFSNFSSSSILSAEHEEYFANNFPVICGFDYGVGSVDIDKQIILEKDLNISVSILVYLAKISDFQWVVFKERILPPDLRIIGEEFYEIINKGIPICYDPSFNKKESMDGKKKVSKLTHIYKLVPKLSPLYRNGLYNNFLIAGFRQNYSKNSAYPKLKRYNDYFVAPEIDSNNLTHPLYKDQKGARLYLLENCKFAIEYLQNSASSSGKDLQKRLDKDGNPITVRFREDPFDALSYPIDSHLLDQNKRQRIEKLWNLQNKIQIQPAQKQIPRGFSVVDVQRLQMVRSVNTGW